jgi:hypothetical protein
LDNNVIFGNMIYQSLQGISGNFTGYNQSIVLTANNYTTGSIFEASVADNTAQTVGSNCFRTTWFTAPYSFNATIDADTSLVVVSAAINTESTNVLSYLLDFNSTDSYFYTSACRQEDGLKTCADSPIYANDSINTDTKQWYLMQNANVLTTLETSGYVFSGVEWDVFSYLTSNDTSIHYSLPVKSEYIAVEKVESTSWLSGIAAQSGSLGFGKASNLVWGVANYTMAYN